MYKHSRTDFIETNLKPAMMENYEGQMESLEALRIDFDKYRKRLKVVKEEKERSRLEFLGKFVHKLQEHLFCSHKHNTCTLICTLTCIYIVFKFVYTQRSSADTILHCMNPCV